MSGILNLLQAITPQQPVQAPHAYEGLEWRWKMFTFRPAYFKFEAWMLGILGAYLALYFIGKTVNMGRAKKSMDPFTAPLAQQFTEVKPMVSSSSALHLLYATGRRNVLCLHATLKLQPLHDIIGLVYGLVWGIIDPTTDNSETLNVTLTLGSGTQGLQGEGVGVWAVVDKGAMVQLRKDRYDLSFPRIHESATLPETHALFSEHSDASDLLLKTANVGITDLLRDPVCASVLKAFIVTDQPAKRPAKGPLKSQQRAREIVVLLRNPSNADETAAAEAWVQVALNVADLLGRPGSLKPDVQRKLVKTRQDTDASLDKAYKKELKEYGDEVTETPEEKRAARKRAERAALSEKELKKVEEKQRKREMRKMQKRGAK